MYNDAVSTPSPQPRFNILTVQSHETSLFQFATFKSAMFPSLQPHRPQVDGFSDKSQQGIDSIKVQPQRPAISLPHQQVRQFQPQLPSLSTSIHSSTTGISSPPGPKNQIEAMPPTFAPLPIPPAPPRSPVFDPLRCHPVFFAQNLRKPPFPMPDTGGGWFNPVATGYVVAERRGLGLKGKL